MIRTDGETDDVMEIPNPTNPIIPVNATQTPAAIRLRLI